MVAPKICSCKKLMRPIICKSNPKASEWYCEYCHKSDYMTEAGEHYHWADIVDGKV